jgi:hypothetical protein
MNKNTIILFFLVTGVVTIFLIGRQFLDIAKKQFTITAGDIEVRFETSSGDLHLSYAGQLFASGNFAEPAVATCEIVPLDSPFGPGKMFKISPGENRVFVRDGSPFVFIRRDPRQSIVVAPYRGVEVLELGLADGIAGSGPKGLSPNGFFDLNDNPGQHLFAAIADPLTNSGVIAGLARIEAASPVVQTRNDGSRLVMTLINEYGAAVPSGLEKFGGDWWIVGFSQDIREGLEAYGDEIARMQNVRLKPCPTGYMSWYSEKYGGALNERAIIEIAQYLKKTFGDYGYDFVQIDDLWQAGSSSNGPAKDFTKVNPTGPYPGGMKPVAEIIKEIGLTPGLWMLPFAINHNDEILSDRKHLVATKPDGSPYEVNWSGTALDLTRPDALAYVGKIIGLAVKEWGYSYLKLDGIHIGMASDQTYPHHDYVEDNFGNVVFHDDDQSNMQAGRAGLVAVRAAAGDKTFILGCAVPQNERSLAMTLGLVDAMRVGPDNVVRWGNPANRLSVVGALRSSAVLYFLNGRVWWNDPDAIYARNSWPLNEVRCYAGWVALTGMLNNQTDWSPDYSKERVDLLRTTMPNHQLTSVRPIDFLENDPARIWKLDYTIDGEKFIVVGLFNWGDTEETLEVNLECLGIEPQDTCYGLEFWENRVVGPFVNKISRTLPGRHCEIISLQKKKNRPLLLGTSRHVTQGAVDLMKLHWSEPDRVWSGTSQVVINDPYELRIYTGDKTNGESSWEVMETTVPETVKQAGVSVEVIHEKDLTRIVISSPVTCSVDWSIRFRKLL